MNPEIFREYDIRGLAERDFDKEFALLLGKVHGTAIAEKGGKRVTVGRDCRATSDSYAEAVIAGLIAAGLQVYDIGICPTPLLYFSLFHLDVDGGIQITASHNPSEYNGFKICLGKDTLYGAQIQEIRARMEERRPYRSPDAAPGIDYDFERPPQSRDVAQQVLVVRRNDLVALQFTTGLLAKLPPLHSGANFLDLRPIKRVFAQAYLEPVVLRRIMARGDLDAAVHIEME